MINAEQSCLIFSQKLYLDIDGMSYAVSIVGLPAETAAVNMSPCG